MNVKPWQLSLHCRLSQQLLLLFWGELHIKQNSVIKLLATVHGLVCPRCYNARYKHHLVTTENQQFASHRNVKKIFCGNVFFTTKVQTDYHGVALV